MLLSRSLFRFDSCRSSVVIFRGKLGIVTIALRPDHHNSIARRHANLVRQWFDIMLPEAAVIVPAPKPRIRRHYDERFRSGIGASRERQAGLQTSQAYDELCV